MNIIQSTTFKNICSPSNDKTIIVGTNSKNQRWFYPVESRHAATLIAKAIMRKNGRVNLTGWTQYAA